MASRRVEHLANGTIRGDDADRWLRDNDPFYAHPKRRFRTGYRVQPQLGDDWADTLEDADLRLHGETVTYFVQAETGGPVKVGATVTQRLQARLAEMQTGNPDRLVYRRVVRGGKLTERAIHDKLAHLRVRPDGEWFRVDEQLADVARAVR